MIEPMPLQALLAGDPLAATQTAIVAVLGALLPGVKVIAHPGKVDLSELVARSVVAAPGIGIGWSRIRRAAMVEGSYGAAVEWTAYIVAEAKVVDNKRVEKEAIGLAIGGRLLKILSDIDAWSWDRTGILPPSSEPMPELKPFFTIRDAATGTVYYVVTWTQVVADIGASLFPSATVQLDPDQEPAAASFDDETGVAEVFWPLLGEGD